MTDDVDTPTLVDPPSGAAPPPSGNGSGGGGSSGEPEIPRRRETTRSGKRAALEWVILIVVAIVIAIVIKTFLFQAFYIPSESMVPTLEVGDRVLVNKLSYDLHDLHRGDIVVFAAEPNVEWHRAGIDDLVKRVIGLPGETITQCETDRVCIDGRLLDESYLPKDTVTTIPETLPYITNAAGKKTLVCDADSPEGACKVPAGKVFVMGDNRTNSQDARANGPIKESSIVGRVFLRIWPPGRIGFM
ncbi:MAG TPA: signal peptidase I [Acidimicrobiia bacterium]|nr:signal peptidase I [Acidimicrobiia bacterium]